MNAPKRHPLVDTEIETTARWYDGKKPGLGTDFVDEVERVIGMIGEQPLRYSVRFNSWRRANLRRFPYSIFYQILEGSPVIFAVLYARADYGPVLESRKGGPSDR
jgi:hypothetical protein